MGPSGFAFKDYIYVMHSILQPLCWILTTGTGGRRPEFLPWVCPKAAELAALRLKVPGQGGKKKVSSSFQSNV